MTVYRIWNSICQDVPQNAHYTWFHLPCDLTDSFWAVNTRFKSTQRGGSSHATSTTSKTAFYDDRITNLTGLYCSCFPSESLSFLCAQGICWNSTCCFRPFLAIILFPRFWLPPVIDPQKVLPALIGRQHFQIEEGKSGMYCIYRIYGALILLSIFR